MRILPNSFFNRSTVTIAEELIGCFIVQACGRKIERFMITETEAYEGFRDKASHASRGKTKRNEIMFRSAGHIYIYFTYGMHWMLNIVTGEEGYPAAVLIRGIKDVEGYNNNANHCGRLDGPARLTKSLGIDGVLNGKKLSRKTGLWIEESTQKIEPKLIKRTPRIGVDYAGPLWSKKKWRFVLMKSNM